MTKRSRLFSSLNEYLKSAGIYGYLTINNKINDRKDHLARELFCLYNKEKKKLKKWLLRSCFQNSQNHEYQKIFNESWRANLTENKTKAYNLRDKAEISDKKPKRRKEKNESNRKLHKAGYFLVLGTFL